MSSEFLIAVPRELPKQDNLVNKGTEEKMHDEDYTNKHLEERLFLSIPGFPCTENFPFNKNIKFFDMPVPNCTATRKHTLDDELDTRLPKVIKLQPEYPNYSSETAVDMVDAVKSQVIKNDVILGENLKNQSINKNEKTDGLVEETSLQQLANETLDTCNSDHISVGAIDVHCCATIDDASYSDRKASDQEQDFLEMETESAALQIQNRNGSPASLVTAQDDVTGTENLLLNTEKREFYPHEFVGAETVADGYQSVHESFSLSEFFICPTSFEQKESCDTLLHPVQEEEAGDSSATAVRGISPTVERKDSQVMFQYESEISGHACTSYDLENKSVGNDVCDSIAHPLDEAQKLSHSAEVGISSNLLHDKIPDSEGVTTGETVVEEFPIKQEVEENPSLHTIHVPSVDLLHNRELDLVDDTVFQNWFMSLVNQETGTESVSTSTYGHHESSDKGHTEDLCSRIAYKENLASALAKSAAAEYSVAPQTKYGNELIGRDLPPPDLIGQSGCVEVADHSADRTQISNEENHVSRFLCFIPSATAPSPTHKMEASFGKVKSPCEEPLLGGLSVPTLAKSPVQIPTTNVQSLENKSDFPATAVSGVENISKPESDIIHKHHKKELIKKFSSGLLEDGKCEMNSSQGNVIQTETTVKDSAVPSTSTAATDEDKCIKDCIVISDSDDDSIIEFDIVKTCTKKRVTKSAHGGSSGKNSRKSTWNTRSSTNEESLGQQARNSPVKSSAILECIVVSDSDDESSKPALPSRNRASNRSEEGASMSDAESRVSLNNINHRDRTESHGVIDLSGGRSPSALSKSNSAVPSAGDSSVGALTTAFAAGDSQSSLVDRFGAHNSGLDTNSSNTFTHIVAAAITYNPAQSNLGGESNGANVIDLSRRNLTPLITSSQNEINSAVDILDLSGSDKKQQDRHSVIKSVGSATENKSATKVIAEEKDCSPAWSCPICFESLLSGRQSVSSTPCGHVFCTKCIEEAVNQFKKCPTCCRKVALKRVHKIFL